MDTIVYFYKRQDAREPVVEPVGLKRYMLIRVALNVGEDTWFGEGLEPPRLAEGDGGACGEPQGEPIREPMGTHGWEKKASWWENHIREGSRNRAGKVSGMIGKPIMEKRGMGIRNRKPSAEVRESAVGSPGFLGRVRRFTGIFGRGKKEGTGRRLRFADRRRESREKLAALRLQQEREERMVRTEEAMVRLAAQIREMAGSEGPVFCVYEDGVRRRLMGKSLLALLWQRHFEWEEFGDYRGRFWVEELMEQARWPDFVILGTAPCMPEVVWKYARRMKSLRWILPEAECTGEFLEFVEEFYVESGLAIALETLPGAGEFARMQLVCAKPSNIIDFTGEASILTSGAAGESVWLDMLSVEEKGRRIRGRKNQISYFSMKEKWKCAQRRCRSPLET